MEDVIRKLRIQNLKAQVVLRQLLCASLAREFETASLTFDERAAIAHRWDEALKECYVLQLMVELMERQERTS